VAVWWTVGYLYDAQDHLTRVTDGEGGVTRYTYSDRDLLTQEISEVSGTTTHRYNEHGQLDGTTDARGVVATRTIDALDRITQVSYPDAEKSVTYTYDDPAVPFSLGQLTRIERGRTRVDYAYDGYGRMIGDGALAYGLDANGNRLTLTYPGGVVATSTYDFADRPASVSLAWPEGGGTQMAAVASGAQYAASGPLRRLTLGNGLIEERAHDQRYYPDRIRVLNGATPVLDWDYTVDAVGNPVRIDETGGPGSLHQAAVPRIYGYQDQQYYLTQGDGPWGALDWTYDRIGNRLSEQRDGGAVEAYDYRANGAGGNTAVLESVNVNRTYSFGAAGHLDTVNAAGNVITFDHDDEGRLGGIARQLGESVTADYDGRGFL
jgi:YD repeat-containing protein